MARIDWTVLCDLAFFDRQDRLCMVGVTDTIPLPRLPISLTQLTLVSHLTELRPVEELHVAVAVTTPGGATQLPSDPECVVIEVVGAYVVATLRFLPFHEAGAYSFQIAVGDEITGRVDVSVTAPTAAPVAAFTALSAEVH